MQASCPQPCPRLGLFDGTACDCCRFLPSVFKTVRVACLLTFRGVSTPNGVAHHLEILKLVQEYRVCTHMSVRFDLTDTVLEIKLRLLILINFFDCFRAGHTGISSRLPRPFAQLCKPRWPAQRSCRAPAKLQSTQKLKARMANPTIRRF